jgi:hypothetical protein
MECEKIYEMKYEIKNIHVSGPHKFYIARHGEEQPVSRWKYVYTSSNNDRQDREGTMTQYSGALAERVLQWKLPCTPCVVELHVTVNGTEVLTVAQQYFMANLCRRQ